MSMSANINKTNLKRFSISYNTPLKINKEVNKCFLCTSIDPNVASTRNPVQNDVDCMIDVDNLVDGHQERDKRKSEKNELLKLEYNWHDVNKGAIEEVGGIESILGIVVPVGALETDTENWPLQYERNNAKYAETRLASELNSTRAYLRNRPPRM